jgi:Tol biopolymer transport system component
VLVVATALILVTMVTAKARAAEDLCPNAEVRVGNSADLPRCRAYEQVSPVDKGYGVFDGEPFLAFAAEEGGAAAFTTNGPLPGSESGSTQNVYLSQRGATSWKLTALTPPQTPIPGSTTFPYTQGFSRNLLQDAVLTANPTLAPGADPDVANLYVRETGPESWRLVTNTQTPENYRWTIEFDGASDDFSHVVFDTREPLLPGVSKIAVYENFGGELRLVGVLPNGEPAEESVFVAQTSSRGYNGVSADGSRVYFLAGGHIYLREDAARTLDVSASQRSEPDPNFSPALFWAATRDGSTAFFTSYSALTDDANTGTDSEGHPTDAGANLYAYDVETESLTDLTVDNNPADIGGAEVLGVVGASDDGSYVYYVARGALAGNAISGEPNLYLRHGGETRFIASLSESDSGNWAAFLPAITSRVTPDGRHVLLSSSARLTGYDNTDAATEAPDTELYLYSAETDALSCVSCRPDGSRPTGSTTIKPSSAILNVTRPFNRYVSDDGSTVVFDTTEPLVPRDNNGQLDVYEFAGGEPRLLSSGSSEFEAVFGDMSADGTDVFFATQAQLTSSDRDLYADLYDARVGGGYAPPPPPLPPCAGGECPRNSSNPPDTTSAIGTSTFVGKGNVKQQRRCRKGAHRVRRHGKTRCVKKQKQGHRGHRRGAGSNKGGSK